MQSQSWERTIDRRFVLTERIQELESLAWARLYRSAGEYIATNLDTDSYQLIRLRREVSAGDERYLQLRLILDVGQVAVSESPLPFEDYCESFFAEALAAAPDAGIAPVRDPEQQIAESFANFQQALEQHQQRFPRGFQRYQIRGKKPDPTPAETPHGRRILPVKQPTPSTTT